MSVAAFLIGFISGEPLIASIGMCLGRGTLISVLCVMTILPALLYVLDKPLGKTVFKKRVKKEKLKKQTVWARALAALDAIRKDVSPNSAPQSEEAADGSGVENAENNTEANEVNGDEK